MNTLLTIFFCILTFISLSKAQNNTCNPGTEPIAQNYTASEIRKWCPQYNGISSCCTQKSVDEGFFAKRIAYPSTKSCSILPDFEDSCSKAFYPTICFGICASIEKTASYTDSSGRLKICKPYAESLFKSCRDYRVCNSTKACASTTNWADGCQKYETYFANAQALVEHYGFAYVEDMTTTTCLNSASRHIPTFLLLMVPFIAFFL